MGELPMADPSLLVLRGIHKRFPGVHALKGVDLEVRRGEIHALVGENGAGKSTLMQILAGVHRPDAGRIDFDGREDAVFRDERASQEAGIALVFQERSLFGPLSVADNVFAARQPADGWGRIDYPRLREQTRTAVAEVGLDVDPDQPAASLSPAQQQLVEIAKALSLKPRLVIFDEPTAALGPADADRLFGTLRRLRADGCGVVYISHRLEEIFTIADRITILKDGAGQGTFAASALTPSDLVSKMVGRELAARERHREAVPAGGGPLLEVAGLSDPPGRRPRLRDISFRVRAGEIVGLAGLVGAGRTELALALFGARPGTTGQIRVEGRERTLRTPADAIAAGIGYLSEDRKESALFLDMSLSENMAAVAAARPGSWTYSERRHRSSAEEMRQTLRIACRGPEEAVRVLSGGNQQKVVLARWLLTRPKVLIVDEPTRGVDVGAKAEMHALIEDLAWKGAAVLVISSDLPEVLSLSDRLLVMREGRLTGELSRAEATEDKVMKLASMG
ncbi:MAG TPA: sugar ABC transporter ATP-binding protein [Planctomycetota bacterium]|nr:sugar ABC transporter ATP-binding protein [Planctomycetota bacterium]